MQKADYSSKKVAVVLSGGSARGLAHIGVLRGLEEMGIKPSIIVGTSMGSIVGALYSWNPHWKWVMAQANRYKIKDMLSFKDIISHKKGLIQGEKFEKLFRELISDAEFRDLQIPLVINATDLTYGETITFTKGNVTDAVRASLSIPLIFNPVPGGGKLLVDGGLTENLYFSYILPKAKEYDLIILVNTTVNLRKLKKKTSFLGVMMQCFAISMQSQIRSRLELLEKDNSKNARLFKSRMVYISPNLEDISPADFGKSEILALKGYRSFKMSRSKIISILARR